MEADAAKMDTAEGEAGPDQSKSALFDQLLTKLRKKSLGDEERMACLLVLTKVMDPTNTQLIGRLHDALGFTFLNRLLKTQAGGEEGELYAAIATSILATYSRIPEIVRNPQFISKIPIFSALIKGNLQPSNESSQGTRDDCLECLLAISLTDIGPSLLAVDRTATPCLLDAVSSLPENDPALSALEQVVSRAKSEVLTRHGQHVISALPDLCRVVAERQDERKFRFCRLIDALLSPEPAEPSQYGEGLISSQLRWARYLYTALNDMLRSKLSSELRLIALDLMATLCTRLGGDWPVLIGSQADQPERGKFLTLATRLACVEIRMSLEDREDPSDITGSGNLLSACYVIVESVITAATKSGDSSNQWAASFVQITHSALADAMAAVMGFLRVVEAHSGTDLPAPMRALVEGSVRVLWAWLAEETSAMRDETVAVLPYCLQLVRQGRPELLALLLPGLCHLTSEDQPRKVFLANGGMALLLKSLDDWWRAAAVGVPPSTLVCGVSGSDLTSACATCLSVCLNVAVLDPPSVASDPIFNDLVNLITSVKQNDSTLQTNCIALTLFILHHKKPSDRPLAGQPLLSFYLYALAFLGDSWLNAEVQELWLLSVQVLSSLVPSDPTLQRALLESPFVPTALMAVEKGDVNDEQQGPLEALLCEVAAMSKDGMLLVKNHGGVSAAQRAKMIKLKKMLS